MVTFDELGLPKLTFEAADTETVAENNVAHIVVIVSKIANRDRRKVCVKVNNELPFKQ